MECQVASSLVAKALSACLKKMTIAWPASQDLQGSSEQFDTGYLPSLQDHWKTSLCDVSFLSSDINIFGEADERMLVSESICKTHSSAYQKDFDQNR